MVNLYLSVLKLYGFMLSCGLAFKDFSVFIYDVTVIHLLNKPDVDKTIYFQPFFQ